MPNFGSYVAGVLVALAMVDVCAQAGLKADTTPASPEVPTFRSAANARYDALLGQELRVSTSSAATADDFRVVINRYWSFVRRYPTSGFADNALWQGATLSAGAFERFHQDRDKFRAVQLFQWLRDQYPHSPLQAKASAQIERLETMAAAAVTTAAPVTAAVSAPPSASDSTIRAVHREVLPDVVRVTVELDREVPFYQERIEGPARLFFDLKGTKTVPSLVDATFRYDSDIIRHIRLGRHPNSTTRVVLDLENVARYSVFTLYNPYRIVIDAERSMSEPIAPAAPVASTRTLPAQTASTSAPTSHIATVDKRWTRLSRLKPPAHQAPLAVPLSSPANPCPPPPIWAASFRWRVSWGLACRAS